MEDTGTNSIPSCETPPRIQCSTLGASAQERHGPAGVRPVDGHKDDHRDGAPLLQRQAERAEVFQLGEKKSPARP